jgi:hypothetical protein
MRASTVSLPIRQPIVDHAVRFVEARVGQRRNRPKYCVEGAEVWILSFRHRRVPAAARRLLAGLGADRPPLGGPELRRDFGVRDRAGVEFETGQIVLDKVDRLAPEVRAIRPLIRTIRTQAFLEARPSK